MKTSAVTSSDLQRSVISVPPLARNRGMGLDAAQNRRIVDHLAAGGVTTLMYGGNANLYNLSVRETAPLAEMLIEIAGDESWVIPSVGADYGKAGDQLAALSPYPFPTVMVLPLAFPATPAGVATGLRRLADEFGRPLIAYVKSDGYLAAADIARLLDDGAVCAIKYAVVRDDPAEDPYLADIVERAGAERVISGIGERPVVPHFGKFGLRTFTSGSVCIAPALSTAILRALGGGDETAAAALRETFLALEDLRDAHSPLRVLHAAVRLAGIADTGPLLPFLDAIEDAALLDAIERASRALLAGNEQAGARAAAE